ncbi:MAG TPA: threonine synthase [Acidimicrobiia bacterium]|nr:threonine synthase [Acidimicrobiia bacterium]
MSTRGEAPPLDFRGVMLTGLAPDGGLYVPETIPPLPNGWEDWSYRQAVTAVLSTFGAEEVGPIVIRAAARFSAEEVAPVVPVGDRFVFELFWGPTLSFKDHALQILGGLLDRDVERPSTILGATSGDTGSAAIEACRGRPQLRVVVLYPEGLVSEFQRLQMTTVEDENVTVAAVKGNFDDCQALVKGALRRHEGLLAFNSINWARVAAQTGYYVFLAGQMRGPFDVVVPTGNFGNILSCWVAKQMGAPIEAMTIANNANRGLSNLVNVGSMGDEEVIPTLAPAMDVTVPSNLERFTGNPADAFVAGYAEDDEILETIAAVDREHGYVLDPHTAAAWHVGAAFRGDLPQVVVGTAHPAKFADAVHRALGRPPETPPGFEDLSDRLERVTLIDADPSALDTLIR